MSDYRIEFRPAALRELRKLDRAIQPRVHGAITLLARDPRPPASRQLRGREGYRLRIGDYRIIYTIDDGILLIVVVTIGHTVARYMGNSCSGGQSPVEGCSPVTSGLPH